MTRNRNVAFERKFNNVNVKKKSQKPTIDRTGIDIKAQN